MIGDTYPKFRAGVVHASPVFLDREATIDKLGKIANKAKEQGADIVIFPESFVPAFPLWCIVYAPIDQHDFYRRLFDNSVLIPGPAFSRLADIAKSQKMFLSVGVTEKSDYSMGAMWNTNLLFDRNGALINRHRKIMPTWAEKLIWALGDGSQLRPAKTEIGNIGTLICGENTNPLCRYALLAQGEQVHISTWKDSELGRQISKIPSGRRRKAPPSAGIPFGSGFGRTNSRNRSRFSAGPASGRFKPEIGKTERDSSGIFHGLCD